MEEITLTKIGGELQVLREMVERIQDYLMEEQLEVSDEVLEEVEVARKGKNIAHRDVIKEFCNE